MPAPRTLLLGYLALLLAERAAELLISARNVRRALARGGVEAGRRHYPAIVALHAAFLAACAAEPFLLPRPWPRAASVAALAAALAAQGLRWWAVSTLGPRWTTRILVLPGAAPVTGGPYRLLRHPNYLAVAVELAAVPLIAGAVITAVAASLADALLLLGVRIPAEERALGAGWARAFARDRRASRGGHT
ncbi:MAG TPA: isoprenylcysteine carboxylmethyltransferase family protein [Anaeromyxobacteraceae bacterium]|nr:isoprenylcysteine carboxylmethyltransferase family protein [Anaeromyxobacteraceae bacterium]